MNNDDLSRYARFTALQVDKPAPLVLRVTIDNPEKMNALNYEAHRQLEEIWNVIDADPSVRVSIITGAGRAFCAGGAVDGFGDKTLLDPAQQVAKEFSHGSRLVRGIIDARKPIISAINGAAVGAGLAIAQQKALAVATKIANTGPTAIRTTKHVLNHWLRQAQPIFDLGLVLEAVQFLGPEAAEAITAQLEKRAPHFPQDSDF